MFRAQNRAILVGSVVTLGFSFHAVLASESALDPVTLYSKFRSDATPRIHGSDGNAVVLLQAAGDSSEESSSMTPGVVAQLMLLGMAAGLIIYYLNATSEETPEFGPLSCLCAIGCMPVGCLACCIPIDTKYTFFTANGGEQRRLLGRGQTGVIFTEEASFTEQAWFESLSGFVYACCVGYAAYAGYAGVMSADSCQTGAMMGVLLLAKAVVMVIIALMQQYFMTIYKEHWSKVRCGGIVFYAEKEDEDTEALHQWLKKVLVVEKVFFLLSICCTFGLCLCFPAGEDDKTRRDEDATCASMQMDSISYFLSFWFVCLLLAILYSLREWFRGKGAAVKDDLRDTFLKKAHLMPL